MAKRYALGEKAGRQLRDMWSGFRSRPTGQGGDPSSPVLWNPGTVEAKVTEAITACSGDTYGEGFAQIYIDSGTTDGAADPAYPDPVKVRNWSETSGTIAVDTHIMICWRNGGWRLVSRDC